MTTIQRNKSTQSPDSDKRNYASVAASLTPIPVAAPIAMKNRFSPLQDDSSDSDSNVDLAQFEWKELDKTLEDEDNVNNMDDDVDNDNAEESVEESSDNTDNSDESNTSEEEIIINHRRYQRVRQPWCRDGVPCAVTSVATLLAFAYFMQFVFYMCGLVSDDCCSPASLLQCSKRF